MPGEQAPVENTERTMSLRDVQQKRILAMRLLDRKYQWREGDVKLNVGNTRMHEVAKFLIAFDAKQNGKQIVTEAIFPNGRRADVFILDDMEAIEIVQSESDESIKKKRIEYAETYGIVVTDLRAGQVVNAWLRKEKTH